MIYSYDVHPSYVFAKYIYHGYCQLLATQLYFRAALAMYVILPGFLLSGLAKRVWLSTRCLSHTTTHMQL